MRYLYSLALYCLIPVILLRMLVRSRIAPEYRRRLAERLGFFSPVGLAAGKPTIWVHAVSVGETLAAAPLIEDLLVRYPAYQLVVTTTTPTGSERVRALFKDRVFHVYAPWDLPGAVQRFLKKIRPHLLVIIETELWPNMLHYSHKHGCRIVLANARMSARSAAGYQRFSVLTRPMLEALDIVACQSQDDSERLLSLGMDANRLEVTGSVKFDIEVDEGLLAASNQIRQSWGANDRDIIIAASTHPGEDEQILAAFRTLRETSAQCLMVLVPRHPERFGEVRALCKSEGWRVTRRSRGISPTRADDIVLGDTMGELFLLLSVADVAIVGGSLVEHGGHNVLEAAAWGVPVITGPHMFNFAEISQLMTDAGAMTMLQSSEDLPAELLALMTSGERRSRMGAAGLDVVTSNRGAKQKLLALIEQQLPVST